MATTQVADGKVINYVAGATIAAGAVVISGDTVGIALVGGVSGDTIAVAIEGVWTVVKVAGTAWVQGDAIDWDASATAFQKGVTPATGDVVLCALAYVAAASGATTGQVKLTQSGLAVT